MDVEIIKTLINGVSPIITALIGAWVALKVEELKAQAREKKLGSPIKKPKRWLWGVYGAIGGAIVGGGTIAIILTYIPTSTPDTRNWADSGPYHIGDENRPTWEVAIGQKSYSKKFSINSKSISDGLLQLKSWGSDYDNPVFINGDFDTPYE